MASLTGNKIKDTYQSLLKTNDNGQITSVSKNITDGFGSGSGLYLKDTGVTLSGSVLLAGISQSPQANILTYDTASGQIYYTASSAIGGGGSGTPGGADTQIQFNSGSSFSGSANLRYDYTTNGLRLTGSLDVSGSGRFTQFVTASAALFSGSGTQILRVVGSGSSEPLMQVLGSQGELFTVTDSLSGSLFSVNDISGLPVVEAFSDSTVLIGNYQSPALNTTILLPSTTVGANTIYTVSTGSYDAIYMDYVIRSGSVGRAGTFTAMWSGSSTSVADISVTPFGDTSGFVFGANISGSDLLISGSGATAGWRVKTIIRSI